MEVKKIIQKINVDIVAIVLVVIFITIFVALSFGRHDSLKSYLNDLGTYDQVIWNTAQGHFFDNSSNMLGQRNYLGAHFSPILLLFVPFYVVFSTPKWLLFFQVLAVAGSGIFIYAFAKEKLEKKWLALVFLAGFLLNPFLQNGILYDFHEVVFAAFFATGAFYFMEKERWKLFLLFSFLLAISQEHLVLLIFMFGLYLFFIKKKKNLGIKISLASMIYFFGVMLMAIPFFSSTGSPALISGNALYPSRYGWLGRSFSEIIRNIFYHPLIIGKILLSSDRLNSLFVLILPVFSLAAYSWPILIILPLLLINLLSSIPMTYSVYYYHSAILIPFVLFSSIITFKRFFSGNLFLEKLFAVFIIIFSIATFYLYSLFPTGRYSQLANFIPSANAKKIIEIEKIIPSDASISVQHNLGPHFSERREVYRFPLKKDEADFIILNRFNPYTPREEKIFGFNYALQLGAQELDNYANELKNNSAFKTVYDDNEYLVLKRND